MTEGFQIIAWSRGESIEVDMLNKALEQINGPAEVTQIEAEDYYALAVHSKGFSLTEEEWFFLLEAGWRNDYPWNRREFAVTSPTEVKAYIKKAIEQQELEKAQRSAEAAKTAVDRELALLAALQKKYGVK